ncbi:MAG: hypothetical protein ACFFDT_04775 [Candidatus Hodarchaeota archaeon]
MKVVYLMGAGVNQVVKDWYGHSPPLLNNFFNIALKKEKYSQKYYSEEIQNVYHYIEKYFKKTKNDLADFPFDLELCFTLLEHQINEAKQRENAEELKELINARFQLEGFLAEVLSDFEYFAVMSHTMRNLGKVILYEQPILITFNYDCMMELVLELASGVNISVPQTFRRHNFFEEEELPDEMLIYSHCNWNRPLGYGFKFDEIQLQQAGISPFVRGDRFYSISQNKLYPKPLLKLHGSLNWFRYLPLRSSPTFPGEPEPEFSGKESEIILKSGTWWIARPPDHNGWLITPIIITPVLYKDEYYNKKPFKEVWEQAKDALSECKKLVFIGYSFSPTDFSTKSLMIESLMENDLEELIVINPDQNLLKVVKELCHFRGGITWYSTLDDYLNTFSGLVKLESKIEEIPEEELPKDTSPHDLYTKCKTCGIEFQVGIRTNPRSFATSQFIGNVYQCPNGHANSYDKIDYVMKKV